MTRSTFTILIVLLLTVSCTPASTQTPILVPASIATQITVSTVMQTPLPSATSTSTAIATASLTNTPTLTPKPIPTEIKLVAPFKTWQGNTSLRNGPVPFTANGNKNWDDPNWSSWDYRSSLPDGAYAISVRALNEKESPIGPAFEYIAERYVPNDQTFRSTTFKYGEAFPYPVDWSLESTIIFFPGFLDGNLSLENVFDKIGDGRWHVLSAVEIHGKDKIPMLIVRDPNSNDPQTDKRVAAKKKDGTSFKIEDGKAYMFKEFTAGDQIFLLINDGEGFTQQSLPKEYQEITPEGFKSGAYGFGSKVGSKMIETPIRIEFRKR